MLNNQQDFATPNTSALLPILIQQKQLLMGLWALKGAMKLQNDNHHCHQCKIFDTDNIGWHPGMANERNPLIHGKSKQKPNCPHLLQQ